VRQSAVSRRIRSLEDALGVSLFERYHGGVRITGAGARFFDRARFALLQLDHAAKTAGAAGRGENGQLRIGIFASIATGFLRELIRRFCEQHPNVGLQISEVAFREHLALIRRGRLDVAFVMGALPFPTARQRSFGQNEFSLFWLKATFFVERKRSNGRLFATSSSFFANAILVP